MNNSIAIAKPSILTAQQNHINALDRCAAACEAHVRAHSHLSPSDRPVFRNTAEGQAYLNACQEAASILQWARTP